MRGVVREMPRPRVDSEQAKYREIAADQSCLEHDPAVEEENRVIIG